MSKKWGLSVALIIGLITLSGCAGSPDQDALDMDRAFGFAQNACVDDSKLDLHIKAELAAQAKSLDPHWKDLSEALTFLSGYKLIREDQENERRFLLRFEELNANLYYKSLVALATYKAECSITKWENRELERKFDE